MIVLEYNTTKFSTRNKSTVLNLDLQLYDTVVVPGYSCTAVSVTSTVLEYVPGYGRTAVLVPRTYYMGDSRPGRAILCHPPPVYSPRY